MARRILDQKRQSKLVNEKKKTEFANDKLYRKNSVRAQTEKKSRTQMRPKETNIGVRIVSLSKRVRTKYLAFTMETIQCLNYKVFEFYLNEHSKSWKNNIH